MGSQDENPISGDHESQLVGLRGGDGGYLGKKQSQEEAMVETVEKC